MNAFLPSPLRSMVMAMPGAMVLARMLAANRLAAFSLDHGALTLGRKD